MNQKISLLLLLLLPSIGRSGDLQLQSYSTPNVYSFDQSAYYVCEDATNAVVSVHCEYGDSGRSGSLQYWTADDTAVAGRDYTAISGDLTFNGPAGSTRTLLIPILPVAQRNGKETFHLILSNYTGATSATLTVLDARPGRISFTQATQHVPKTNGTVAIPVVRVGGAEGSLTVDYATADPYEGTTAVEGVDFQTARGTITFNTGETNKTILLTLSGSSSSAEKQIVLSLKHPFGAGRLVQDKTTVIIDPSPIGPTASAQPKLTLGTGTDGNIEIRWPAALQEYVVEGSDSFLSSNWTPLSETPVQEGVVKVIRLESSNNRKFFRLRHAGSATLSANP